MSAIPYHCICGISGGSVGTRGGVQEVGGNERGRDGGGDEAAAGQEGSKLKEGQDVRGFRCRNYIYIVASTCCLIYWFYKRSLPALKFLGFWWSRTLTSTIHSRSTWHHIWSWVSPASALLFECTENDFLKTKTFSDILPLISAERACHVKRNASSNGESGRVIN